MTTTFTYASTVSNSKPVTLDSIKATLDDFGRKFPKSERAVKMRCGYRIQAELERQCEAPGAINPMKSAYGLPIEIDPTGLPYPSYAIEFADGTEEVHCGDMVPVRRPINKRDGFTTPLTFDDIFPLSFGKVDWGER